MRAFLIHLLLAIPIKYLKLYVFLYEVAALFTSTKHVPLMFLLLFTQVYNVAFHTAERKCRGAIPEI